MVKVAAIFGLSMISLAANAADYPAAKEGDWVARDFRFHTGEVLPEVRLHYRTIGKPEGIPVVVLHGYRQFRTEHVDDCLCRRIVRTGTATRRREIFHHPSRCDRSREFDQAVGWAEDEVSAIQLRRHGGCAVSPGRRGPWHQTRAHGRRQFDGWHERLAMGRERFWLQ